MAAQVDQEKAVAYWKYNVKLTTTVMVIWFVVTYVCTYFVKELNSIVLFGFPFGYYMGAQGSLAIFVILIFWYALKMNKADEEYGVGEEEEE
jgi:putative solute:sodium symporter small subunit